MKEKGQRKLTQHLILMSTSLLLLIAATAAWLINSAAPAAETMGYRSDDLQIETLLTEVDSLGKPITQEQQFLLMTADGTAETAFPVDGILPGQSRFFKLTLQNKGAAAQLHLGVSKITLGVYTENGEEKVGELDHYLLFSMDKAGEKPQPVTPLPPNRKWEEGSPFPVADNAIVQLRQGKTTFSAGDVLLAEDETVHYYAVFTFDSLATEFADGGLRLKLSMSGALART